MKVQLAPNITCLIQRILFIVYSTDEGTACTEYNLFNSKNIVYSVQCIVQMEVQLAPNITSLIHRYIVYSVQYRWRYSLHQNNQFYYHRILNLVYSTDEGTACTRTTSCITIEYCL